MGSGDVRLLMKEAFEKKYPHGSIDERPFASITSSGALQSGELPFYELPEDE